MYHFNEDGALYADTKDAEMNGLIRLQIKKDFYNKVLQLDTRAGSRLAVYQKDAIVILVYVFYLFINRMVMIAGSHT